MAPSRVEQHQNLARVMRMRPIPNSIKLGLGLGHNFFSPIGSFRVSNLPVSKHRPSNSLLYPSLVSAGDQQALHPAHVWRRRIFKNTFTRAGRRLSVKGWSVKIQYRGIRRTFSLVSADQAGAAVEAQAIYQIIVTQGWGAAPPSAGRGASRSDAPATGADQIQWPKTDVRYWKPRLIFRSYSWPGAIRGRKLSVRIEHAGVSHYFPVGLADPNAAAERALEIYQTIVKHGWAGANERFSRELTLALHWTDNPLAWTYTTLHTQPIGALVQPLVPARLKALRPSAAIIEADDTIRRALADCVNQHSSFSCNPGFAGTQEGFREFRDRAPRLVLINRLLTTGARIESSAQLSKLPTEMPKLVYSVYEDSDQLFKATPGGASGYLLKRTTPDKLLEPIARLASGENFSPKLISFHIRQYFREVIDSLPTVETSPDLAKLTQREQEILNLLSKGYVDKEIADALRISIWTVHGHMKNIFEKLDVHTRTEAVVKYLHK